MNVLRTLWFRLQPFLRRRKIEAELNEEIRTHLEMAEEHLARASDRNSFDAQNVVATQAVAHATLALAYFAAIEHGKTVLANADAPPG